METQFCVICGLRVSAAGGAWADASGEYGNTTVEPHFHRPERMI